MIFTDKYITPEQFMEAENYSPADEAQSPFWFLNDKLEDKELIRQLQLMREAGIKSCAPHARSGYIGGYMDEEWFHSIETILEDKKAHGETAWIYDEFNWPAGSCNGEVSKDEKLRERYLYFTEMEVKANTLFHAQLKPFLVTDIDKGKSFQELPKNIFCFDAETMEPLDLTPYLKPMVIRNMDVGLDDFELLRDRDTIVFQVQLLITPYSEGGRGEPNYLKKEATEKFISLTYEGYKRRFPEDIGKTVRVFFNDETRFAHSYPWTEQLPEKFIEMKGYDIREHLPDLILPGDEAGRTRVDYYDVIAQLYKENYHGTLRDWCEKNGMEYTAHLLGEETIGGQTRFSGDFMRQIDAMTRPGVDHLGKGIGSLNVKFTTSAGELYGKKKPQVEIYAGCGWDLSFEEYLRMSSWMYFSGIRTIVNHGFFYSIRDERSQDWPPSEFFQWDHWNRMGEANRMCRRMYALLEGGHKETEVLIYHPMETFWLHYLGKQGYQTMYQRGPLLADERAAEIDKKEQILLNGLLEQNIDYIIFPSDAARLFKAENGRLVNTRTGQSFSTFVLPMAEVLPAEMAKLLDKFAREGGNLCVMDCYPKYGTRKADDETVFNIFANLKAEGKLHFIAEGDDMLELGLWLNVNAPSPVTILEGMAVCPNNHPNYPEWIVDPIMHNDEDLSGVAYNITRDGDRRTVFFVNFSSTLQTLTLRIPSKTDPEVWETFTGKVYKAEQAEKTEDGYIIRISLEPNVGTAVVTTI